MFLRVMSCERLERLKSLKFRYTLETKFHFLLNLQQAIRGFLV